MERSSSAASTDCDVLVVGGGINGAGIARDLAGRGLAVVLCERDDLASHTSSSSTKLVHGGLRYLEHRAFGLVRRALVEREIVLASAPHLAWPLGFVMPHEPALRPAWLIRAGLFLYDHLATRRTLPRAEAIDLRTHVAGRALKGDPRLAFAYADGWVDDARLVVANAIDARDRGATVAVRTTCVDATRTAGTWTARLENADGTRSTVRARSLVNATGPWAARFLQDVVRVARPRPLRLVKGSHIVVAKRFDHPFAYVFQGADRRIVFAIPYEDDYTLIGTTDVDVDDPADDRIGADEIAYLCTTASAHFARPVAQADVVWSYSGVRPLVDDAATGASDVTRDHALDCDDDGAPLVTVRGGKLTTYRALAEQVADRLCATLRHDARSWTRTATLPGGDIGRVGDEDPQVAFSRFRARLAREHPWLPAPLVARFARTYGSRASRLLDGAHALADLGDEVAPALHEAELRHLVRDEWAMTADDVLWRRTKLGLRADAAAVARVAAWLAARR